MLFTKAGVSDITTTLGLDPGCKLRVALLRQFKAACAALTDLKHGTQELASLISLDTHQILHYNLFKTLKCVSKAHEI